MPDQIIMKENPMKRSPFQIITLILLVAGLNTITGCKKEPGYCKENFSEKILTFIDKSVKDLKLNAEQQKQYEAMRTEAKANIDQYIAERKKVSALITQELNSDKVDMNKIASIMKENPPIREDAYRAAIDKMMKFYDILDDKQKIKVVGKIKKFQERFSCKQ